VFRAAFLGLLALAVSPSSASAQTPEPAPFCITAWYPSSQHRGGYETLMTHSDVIDVVNPFWYTPNRDGTLRAGPGAENAVEIAAWREAGMPIIPSLHAGDPALITDPALRETHIAAIVDLARAHDYDGIDVDYEGFPVETRDDFSLFIEQLAGALHADGRVLSIAVHAKTDDQGAWEGPAAQDWPRLSAAVDVFAIMTYDFGGGNAPPMPIGPTPWVIDVLDYAATITDLRKVRMGLHLYGYQWMRAEPPASPITYEDTQRLIDAFGPEVQRDPSDLEPFVDFTPEDLPRRMIYYADAESVRFKLGRVLDAHPELGGIAIWGLGGEDPAVWEVLRELRPAPCGG